MAKPEQENDQGASLAAGETARSAEAVPQRSHVEPEITEVEIDPAIWLRGEGSPVSYLLRHDGKRCCIGIACQAAGIPDEVMIGVQVVYDTFVDLLPPWGKELRRAYEEYQHGSGEYFFTLNDSEAITSDAARVEFINADLKTRDIPLRFTLKDTP